MNSSFIDKCLRYKFHSHKYQLSNSFVYREESDFFSITSTGYAQEVEVKVSRSDFKADFKKYKHNSFEQIYKGQKFIVRKGAVEYKIWDPIMETLIGEDGKAILTEDKYGRMRPKRGPSGKFRQYTSLMGDDYANKRREQGIRVEAVNTHISIFKPILPNKFWFAVPEGLVSLDEVPEYAGLYYVSEDGKVTTVRRAPFIHKEKHNLNQVLLDKFYYLSQKLERNAY